MANTYQDLTQVSAELVPEGVALEDGTSYLLYNNSDSEMYVFEGAEADLVEKKEVPVPPGPPGFFVKKGTDPIFVRSRLGTQLAIRPAYVTVSVSS